MHLPPINKFFICSDHKAHAGIPYPLETLSYFIPLPCWCISIGKAPIATLSLHFSSEIISCLVNTYFPLTRPLSRTPTYPFWTILAFLNAGIFSRKYWNNSYTCLEPSSCALLISKASYGFAPILEKLSITSPGTVDSIRCISSLFKLNFPVSYPSVKVLPNPHRCKNSASTSSSLLKEVNSSIWVRTYSLNCSLFIFPHFVNTVTGWLTPFSSPNKMSQPE